MSDFCGIACFFIVWLYLVPRLKPCQHVKNDMSGTIHSGDKFCRAAALQPGSKRSVQ